MILPYPKTLEERKKNQRKLFSSFLLVQGWGSWVISLLLEVVLGIDTKGCEGGFSLIFLIISLIVFLGMYTFLIFTLLSEEIKQRKWFAERVMGEL